MAFSAWRFWVCLLAGTCCLIAPLSAAAADDATAPPVSHLSAANLLLIVNKNEPAGLRLANFYAEQRHLPADRIVSLDLPTADELSADDYATKVAPPVRAFLHEHNLADTVTCLVTFYGVPLRVGPRSNSPAESAEYRELSELLDKTTETIKQAVTAAEDLAKQVQPDFKPAAPADRLATRADHAINVILNGLAGDKDDKRRNERFNRLTEILRTLYGPLELAQRMTLPPYERLAPKPLTAEERAEVQQKINRLVQEMAPVGQKAATDPEARRKLRETFAANLGAFRTLQVITEYKLRLETRETEAAVDSELACLWWPDGHVRYRWHENPLHFRIRFAAELRAMNAGTQPSAPQPPIPPPSSFPKTLMVMRLDAPTEQQVHNLITTCSRVEQEGLKGTVVIDARGKPPTDAYGAFDEALRRLAADLHDHTKLSVLLDNKEPVLQPGAAKDVAIYCGWYSLRHYVPGMTFVPGAVGYHVASSELVSLHNPKETGWVRGLMNDGVVATLGPVAEPYLHSFPNPDEFFPLLMTGKLKLAEVYWLTNPLVSWMNTCIGDPLYTPFAKDPPLKSADLPATLRPIFLSLPSGSASK